MKRLAALSTILVALGWAGAAEAQAPGAGPARGERGGASAYLGPHHWTRAALRRLDALGLLPAHAAGDRGVSRAEMAAFLEAAARAGAGSPAEPVVRAYRARFCRELPAWCEAGGAGFRPDGVEPAIGYAERDGALETALGRPTAPLEPPAPRADLRTPTAGLSAAVAGPVAAAVDAVTTSEGGGLREGYAAVRLGAVGVWAGRRPVGFGYGQGSVVLDGRVALDGVGVQTRSFRLPWLLRHLGPVRVHTGLFRLDEVAPVDDPWLWTSRATLSPHPRLAIGLTRAAMVELGEEDALRNLQRLLQIMVGKHSADNELDNQIASVDLRFRPPLGSLPLALYLEWGLEDSAGAWRDVPGVLRGAYLGAVPGLPAVALGVENATFARSCCGNPSWYRHYGFEGGWTDGRTPLGHGLGGHGAEWRGWADIAGSAGTLTVAAFRRDRHSENLYAPTRTGTSGGAEVEVRVEPAAGLYMDVRGVYEAGDGWDRRSIRAALSWRF